MEVTAKAAVIKRRSIYKRGFGFLIFHVLLDYLYVTVVDCGGWGGGKDISDPLMFS